MPARPVYVTESEVAAVLSACRVLVAVSTRSASMAPHRLNPAEFRLLLIIADGGLVSLGELAATAGLTLPAARRICERMAHANLIDRFDTPTNRLMHLRLTDAGRDIVGAGAERRRQALDLMLRQLPPLRRLEFVEVLHELATVGPDTCNGHHRCDYR